MTGDPRRKQLRRVGIVSLFVVASTVLSSPGAAGTDPPDVQERFLGAWHLVSLEEEGVGGKIYRADCSGMIVFTRDGHISVQVMYRNPTTGEQTGQVQYAQGGYEASFGTYQVDPNAHTFTYHVDGALVRTLIGKNLVRSYEFNGNTLTVKAANPSEHWKVVWEHD